MPTCAARPTTWPTARRFVVAAVAAAVPGPPTSGCNRFDVDGSVSRGYGMLSPPRSGTADDTPRGPLRLDGSAAATGRWSAATDVPAARSREARIRAGSSTSGGAHHVRESPTSSSPQATAWSQAREHSNLGDLRRPRGRARRHDLCRAVRDRRRIAAPQRTTVPTTPTSWSAAVTGRSKRDGDDALDGRGLRRAVRRPTTSGVCRRALTAPPRGGRARPRGRLSGSADRRGLLVLERCAEVDLAQRGTGGFRSIVTLDRSAVVALSVRPRGQ